jgi:hypothetical protein
MLGVGCEAREFPPNHPGRAHVDGGIKANQPGGSEVVVGTAATG